MKNVRRAFLALLLASGLSLTMDTIATASSQASPVQNISLTATSAAGCPAEGTRFKVPGQGDMIFFIGPKGFKYYIPDPTVYFQLWGSWDGVVGGVQGCSGLFAPLTNGHLAKLSDPNAPAVYIWDASWPVDSYRHIVDWATFTTKYHFDPAKIRMQSTISPFIDAPWT